MNKTAVFLTVLLVASIAGTVAVYELYVKDRMRELVQHSAQKKRIADRIGVLETTFLKTQPQVILDEWRKSTQPWSEAVDGRSRFFTLGPLAVKVEIPQEVLPKIYYKDALPKRIKKLEDYAADKGVAVADTSCGVPRGDSFGQGTNPKREEIVKYLEDYDYCAAMTMMLIDTKPTELLALRIWPEDDIGVKSGTIKKRTTGITMKARTQSLAKFLDSLAGQDRYVRVEELKLTNTDLQQQDPLLSVDMVLSQAYFVPSKKSAMAASGSPGVNQTLDTVFGGGARKKAYEEVELTGWQLFRKNWLPF